ncbi:hypothetical protein HYQ46_005903 [Verticillium longisporum]|nr:hypothetical protein HYQ46_005903 [Verticillium longisporum]
MPRSVPGTGAGGELRIWSLYEAHRVGAVVLLLKDNLVVDGDVGGAKAGEGIVVGGRLGGSESADELDLLVLEVKGIEDTDLRRLVALGSLDGLRLAGLVNAVGETRAGGRCGRPCCM